MKKKAFFYMASILILLPLIITLSVRSQVKTKIEPKALDKDIEYINRMRNEIEKGENSADIEPLRRHSAPDIVLIPDGMPPVSGQENALDLMRGLWMMFEVKTEYQSEEVKIVGDTAIDRGWAKETLKNKKTNEITEHRANYLWFSQKNKNGVWKQTYVIWNKRSE